MNDYKANFQNFSSEYLIQKRALGSELADAAHRAIEEIFKERGETLPPRPSKPIDVVEIQRDQKRRGGGDKFLGIVAIVLAMVVAKTLSTMFGLIILVGYAIYWVFNWVRKRGLTEEERASEHEAQQIEEEGLTELMVCAANGDVQRVKELVAYGADVDKTSLKGSTALIYAARNNQMESVKALLAAGANALIKTDKGATALQIAERFGHHEIAGVLSQHELT